MIAHLPWFRDASTGLATPAASPAKTEPETKAVPMDTTSMVLVAAVPYFRVQVT
jgi:hypothetical protein